MVRDVLMLIVPRNKKDIWENHSSYQWLYFAEQVKQRISYFLSDKLFGKNLDLGGGRYLTYPHSTVVDISSHALEYNPAKEKVEFDLDAINEGAKLPFPDHSFDHATMVSVYQYVKGGELFIKELQRVLKPGAELYIINMNGGGSGISDEVTLHHSTSINGMHEEFKKAGYQTLVENIPFRQDTTGTQSLCVAMPGRDIFGDNQGQIRDLQQRELLNEWNSRYKPYELVIRDRYSYDNDENFDDETRHTDYFTALYSKREIKKMNDLFYKIATYPVTPFSVEYRKNIEAFTQECLTETDCIPLIISSTSIDIRIDMATSAREIRPTIHVVGKTAEPSPEDRQRVKDLAQKYNLGAEIDSSSFPYFNGHTLDKIIDNYEKREKEYEYEPLRDSYRKKEFSDEEQGKIISFLSEVPLNSIAKDFQERLYTLVKSRGVKKEEELVKEDEARLKDREKDIKQWRKDVKKWNEKNNSDNDLDDDDEKPRKPERPEPITRPWRCQLDNRITRQKAKAYFYMLLPRKQRRSVETLLGMKEQYLSGEKNAVGWKSIDYLPFIALFPDFFEVDDLDAYRGSKMMPDY